MLDVGFSELLVFAIIALIVLGPEKLPHAARMAGAWYVRIRRTVSNIQREIEQEVNAAEMRSAYAKQKQALQEGSHALQSEIHAIPQHITDIYHGSTQPVQARNSSLKFYYLLAGEEKFKRSPPAPFLPNKLL